jgi:hypothetical protein
VRPFLQSLWIGLARRRISTDIGTENTLSEASRLEEEPPRPREARTKRNKKWSEGRKNGLVEAG